MSPNFLPQNIDDLFSHRHHSHPLSAFHLIVCPVFFVYLALPLNFILSLLIRVLPLDDVTRGGPRSPPSDATAQVIISSIAVLLARL